MSSDLNSDVTFRNLVQRMRTAQITYFKNRDGDSLYKSRQLEKEVDKMLPMVGSSHRYRSIGGKRAIMRVKPNPKRLEFLRLCNPQNANVDPPSRA